MQIKELYILLFSIKSYCNKEGNLLGKSYASYLKELILREMETTFAGQP